MSMQTCRFCDETIWNPKSYVKYGVRHYAHHDCYLIAGKTLRELHDWQIVQFPYRLLKDFGLMDEALEATKRLARENEMQS